MSRSNKCDKCGGSLEYHPCSGNLLCKKCGEFENFDTSNDYTKHSFDMEVEVVEPEFNPKVSTLHCSSCGAIFKAKTINMSDTCTYCGTHLTMDFTLSKNSEPDGCIPFAFDKEEGKKKFLEGLKKKKFIPNDLKKQLPNNEIESVYIPSYLFRIETENDYYGRLYDTDRDSNGNSKRRYRKISGKQNFTTDKILIECSSQINQLTLDKIRPFDVGHLKKFKSEYLMGYSVEYYDRKLQEVKSLVKESVKYDVRKRILSGYSYDGVDYLDINTRYTNCKYSRILLPTYRFTYKYGNKEYKTYLNGQTGKLGGNLPRSKFKITALVLGILAVIGVIAYLFIK